MNLTFDEMRKLQQKKYREKFGYFIAEGEHLVQELENASALNPALHDAQLFICSEESRFARSFSTHTINAKQMARICDTQTPQGIFALVPVAALGKRPPSAEKEKVVYLHEVQDPGNLGTILRTLAWFGAARCLLSAGSVDPFNPKVVRASMGAVFHVPIEIDVPLESIVARYPRIAALDMNGIDIADSRFAQNDVYVFGNEARGVPMQALETIRAEMFTIPGKGSIESLNLGTVVSICAYALARAT